MQLLQRLDEGGEGSMAWLLLLLLLSTPLLRQLDMRKL
jgi:hypothetical protein